VRLFGADRPDGAILQDTEELGLGLEWQLADLVQERRGPVSQVEEATALTNGARERAALVAGELALEQRPGDGGTVLCDERPIRPVAAAVDHDTKYSWDPAGGHELALETVVAEAAAHPCRRVVVTGGEPPGA